MMNMMNNSGWNIGFSALWGVHILSVILFFAGVAFLMLWAAKTLKPEQMKTWGIALVVIGAIACLLTIGMRGAPWNTHTGNFGTMRMMQSNNGNNAIPKGMMENGMGMSMMLQGRAGDDFDQAFLTLMIPHHQDAINMANDALKNAKHDEIKQMARDIITAQQKEIDMMKGWQESWGYTE